jgi:hypothetical protein
MEIPAMFEDPIVAARAMELVKRLLGDLDQLLIELEPVAPAAEYKECRYAVGHVINELFERLAEPIATNHAQLRYW